MTWVNRLNPLALVNIPISVDSMNEWAPWSGRTIALPWPQRRSHGPVMRENWHLWYDAGMKRRRSVGFVPTDPGMELFRGIQLPKLSRACGITAAHLWQITHRNRMPSFPLAFKLSQSLGCTLDELYHALNDQIKSQWWKSGKISLFRFINKSSHLIRCNVLRFVVVACNGFMYSQQLCMHQYHVCFLYYANYCHCWTLGLLNC